MKAAPAKMAKAEKNNPRPLWDLTQEVAPGFIRLTRRGKTVAYVLLASHYDEEDIETMTNPEFWEMIRQSRESDFGTPWEQVKVELGLNGDKKASRTTSPGRSRKKSTR